MEAISALCVSTASCGAAAIGCAYGRVDAPAATVLERGFPDGDDTERPTSHRVLLERPPATPSTPLHLRRPHSLNRPPSSSLWPGLAEESGRDALFSPPNERPLPSANETPRQFGGVVDEGTGSARASWIRRMSAIPQSVDGSLPSSPGPSSPSHVSNVPLFPPTVIPRNKLVKRSTSLRILHSGYQEHSPLTAGQTSTFRRPVTSYQRSEQLRRHQLQKDLEHAGSDLVNEDYAKRAPTAGLVEPIGTIALNRPGLTWQPYFLVQSIRTIRDLSRGSPFAKSPSATETVPCVRTLPGSAPALVRASDVSKPTLISGPVALRFLHRADDVDVDQAEPGPASAPSRRLPKSRHSFSFGDIMSTPPVARKLRRGESARQEKATEPPGGRRIVSAPLHEARLLPEGALNAGADRTGSSHSSPDRSARRNPTLRAKRISSSPLPPLQRLSAFELDLPEENSSSPPTPDAFPTSSPTPGTPSTSDALERAGYSAIRFKPRRRSRIPSDRASTAFSSENEQSRVFSVDGDDVDYRSETVYDSIRTDATSSSHSGAKVYHADSVFAGASPEPSSILPLALHDRTTIVSVPGSKVHDVRINEEEESVKTPSHSGPIWDAETPTPAPRIFHLTPPDGSNRSPAYSPRIAAVENAGEETEGEDFWSVLEQQQDFTDEDDHASFEIPGAWTISQQQIERNRSPERRLAPRPPVNGDDNLNTTITSVETNLPAFATQRGSRSGRRIPPNLHLRSQSVPLPTDNNGPRFNNATRLESWVLGSKGISEDWDNDFEFDEPSKSIPANDNHSIHTEKGVDLSGVLVPPAILDRQASVHGQFGQVKKFTQLVEELRDLREQADKYGLAHGQSSELWREAEGIIDLATLDNEDIDLLQPHSPHSSSIDFDAFDEEPSLPRPQTSSPPNMMPFRLYEASSSAETSLFSSSPLGSRQGTPLTRPRKESVAKAKHVLENIHQHRNVPDPPIPQEEGSPRKLPFDTTSLRDLVTRAGVVTRALREIVRRAEDPEHASTPDRMPLTPPEPAFSQIFHPSASPPSSRKSCRSVRRENSGSVLGGAPGTENDRNGHIPIMSVV